MPFTPISDDNPHDIEPTLTWIFVAINFIILVFSLFLSPEALGLFYKYLGVVPAELWGTIPPQGVIPEKVTLLTSAFLHAGPVHFIFNMLFFVIFADNIEYAFGNLRYILFCLAAALISSLGHAFLNATSTIPSIGFSGVVSAILGAYVVLYPHARVNLITPAWLYFFRNMELTFQMPAWLIIGIWFSQDLIGIFTAERDPQAGGVAFAAHISGFLFGLLMARILRINTSPYDLKELKEENGRSFIHKSRADYKKNHERFESDKDEDMWGHR